MNSLDVRFTPPYQGAPQIPGGSLERFREMFNIAEGQQIDHNNGMTQSEIAEQGFIATRRGPALGSYTNENIRHAGFSRHDASSFRALMRHASNHSIFDRIDTNNNGKLTVEEIMQVFP
jgi:hypothetical protein